MSRLAVRLAAWAVLTVSNGLLSYAAVGFYEQERDGTLSTLALLVLCCWLAIQVALVAVLAWVLWVEHRPERVDEPDPEMTDLYDRLNGG
jgi:uncharacterized membrane protein HdeD (DUF308 family)